MNNRKILKLLIAFISFLMISLLGERVLVGFQEKKINPVNVEKTLYNKEYQLDTILNSLVSKMSSYDDFDKFLKKLPVYPGLLENNGIVLLIYKNDSLRFWTDNSLPVFNLYSQNDFAKKLIRLDNSWVIAENKQVNNVIFVGLILLKYQYSITNDFFSNDFPKEFNIPPNTVIIKGNSEKGVCIHDKNRVPLFTLVQKNTFKENSESLPAYIFALFFLISVVLFIFLFYYSVNKLFAKLNLIWRFFFFLVLVFALWMLLAMHLFPANLYNLDFFSPDFYASSLILPSLGDLFIYSACTLSVSFLFYKHFSVFQTGHKYRLFKATIILLFNLLIFFLINGIFVSLVDNSTFSLEIYKVMVINKFSILSYLVIFLLFFSFILVTARILSFISLIKSPPVFSFNFLVFLIFLFSIYLVWLVTTHSSNKEKIKRKVLVVKLSNERDPVAETLFHDLGRKILSDTILHRQLGNYMENMSGISKYVQNNYLNGFWDKYELQVNFCGEGDSLLNESSNRICLCNNLYDSIITNHGLKIENTDFYFLDNIDGRINYLGVLISKSTGLKLFIDLRLKPATEDLGYPELLLDNKLHKSKFFEEYSYAKYKNGKLIAQSQSGDYNYNLDLGSYKLSNEEFYFAEFEKYDHLIYNAGNQNTIIISRPSAKTVDFLVSFSYTFVLFFLIFFLAYFFSNVVGRRDGFSPGLKTKIQFSMISVLLLSFLFIGGGTIYYVRDQVKSKNLDAISEKLKSVTKELENKFGDERSLSVDMRYVLTNQLINLSNIFYTDINIYDLKGNILASSRPEIFENGLLGTMINSEAFNKLRFDRAQEYIHNEKIGNMIYLSIYTPFCNNSEKLLAYINLPYFTKQNLIKDEISRAVNALVNIYVLLILITIFIAILISGNITRPLAMLRKSFMEIKLNRKNTTLDYSRNDEIGELVRGYNSMVEELLESAEKLARSEREYAWREMAKQIAHEIKNPLTPMKLSVQQLVRAFDNKSPGWENYFENVTKTVIEQIDILSSIATEFSHFAKMPVISNEKFKVLERIQSSVNLYKVENVEFVLNLNEIEDVFIVADKEQILRVFNNLIKNAVQSFSDERPAMLIISGNIQNEKLILGFKDNGSGIPDDLKEKIFTPNFTTKNSGMGLGLAISKNIIENAGGRIWFETGAGFGTSFFIELPVA